MQIFTSQPHASLHNNSLTLQVSLSDDNLWFMVSWPPLSLFKASQVCISSLCMPIVSSCEDRRVLTEAAASVGAA